MRRAWLERSLYNPSRDQNLRMVEELIKERDGDVLRLIPKGVGTVPKVIPRRAQSEYRTGLAEKDWRSNCIPPLSWLISRAAPPSRRRRSAAGRAGSKPATGRSSSTPPTSRPRRARREALT